MGIYEDFYFDKQLLGATQEEYSELEELLNKMSCCEHAASIIKNITIYYLSVQTCVTDNWILAGRIFRP